MLSIVNTLAEYPVGFTWANHKAAGYQGGVDYIVHGGVGIKTGVAGTAMYAGRMADGNHMVDVVYATGKKVSYRELNSTVGSFPRKVQQFDVIGLADVQYWVHQDATTNGVRVPYESIVTHLSTAGTGIQIIIIPPEETTMAHLEFTGAGINQNRRWFITENTHTKIPPEEEAAYTLAYGKPKKVKNFTTITTLCDAADARRAIVRAA